MNNKSVRYPFILKMSAILLGVKPADKVCC
jgi:hypothetical protein